MSAINIFKSRFPLQQTNVALAVSLFALTITSQPAWSRLTSDQIQAAITKEKILPADSKITVAVNGAELLISTYKVDIATESDCKIDAVLLAKTAFGADPELTRTIVRFFDVRQPNTYYGASVTVGDVAAFGSGKVSKDQLLSALKISRVSSEQNGSSKEGSLAKGSESVAPITSATDSTAQGAPLNPIAGAGTTPPGTQLSPAQVLAIAALLHSGNPAHEAKPSTTRIPYRNYGISFSHPADWTIDSPKGTNILVRFFGKGEPMKGGPIIEIHLYAANAQTPEGLITQDLRSTFMDASQKTMLIGAPPELSAKILKYHADEARSEEFKKAAYIKQNRLAQFYKDKQAYLNSITTSVPVAIPEKITIGTSKTIHALQRAIWSESQLGNNLFIRTVAFTCSGYVFQFGLVSPKDTATAGNATLDQMCSEIVCAKTEKSSAHAPAAKK